MVWSQQDLTRCIYSSLQSLLGGCSDYVLKYEKGFAWSLCCDMLLDTCTCCQSCSWTLSLVGATASVIFVTTTVLSQQTYVCHDKQVSVTQKTASFVATKVCLWKMICCNKHIFATAKHLLWETYFCHDKHILHLDKSVLVVTELFVTNTFLSWQTFCGDKNDTCGSSCQW